MPLALVTFLTYIQSDRALRREVANHLQAQADQRGQQIEAFVRERRLDAGRLARTPTVAEALETFRRARAGPDPDELAAAKEKYQPFLVGYLNLTQTAGYSDLILVGADGRRVYSVRDEGRTDADYSAEPLRSTELGRVLEQALRQGEGEVSDFAEGPGEAGPVACAAAPVLRDGRPAGAVALEFGIGPISEVVHDYTGLGDTGRTELVRRRFDRLELVTHSRFEPATTPRRSMPLDAPEAAPLALAARGRRGSGEFPDGRGRTAVAAWRFLPSMRWGVVVRVDSDEAFAPVARQRNAVL